jgi:hypothetical protein
MKYLKRICALCTGGTTSLTNRCVYCVYIYRCECVSFTALMLAQDPDKRVLVRSNKYVVEDQRQKVDAIDGFENGVFLVCSFPCIQAYAYGRSNGVPSCAEYKCLDPLCECEAGVMLPFDLQPWLSVGTFMLLHCAGSVSTSIQ